MGSHRQVVLSPGSPFIGQNCPVSRQTLRAGQEVMICDDTQTAFLLESWKYLGATCPLCPADQARQAEPAAGPVSTEATSWLVLAGRPAFPLAKEITNLGRGPDNDIVLDDVATSYHHARIQRMGKTAYLFDLTSTNGTWVNDQRVYRLLLMDGDTIRLGNTDMVFKQLGGGKFIGGADRRKSI